MVSLLSHLATTYSILIRRPILRDLRHQGGDLQPNIGASILMFNYLDCRSAVESNVNRPVNVHYGIGKTITSVG